MMIEIAAWRCLGACSHEYCELPSVDMDTDDLDEALDYVSDLHHQGHITDAVAYTGSAEYELAIEPETSRYYWRAL